MRRPAGSQAFVFVFITALLDSIGFGIIMPVLPQLVMEVTGEGLASAARYGGLLMFAYAGMQFFVAPVIGNLSDRFGRRPVLRQPLTAPVVPLSPTSARRRSAVPLSGPGPIPPAP